MKQEILVKLKSAEDDTARRVEAAKVRAAELLKQARVRAEEIRRAALEESRADHETQLKAERAGLEKERLKVLAEGKAREERLRSQYAKNAGAHVKKAVDVFARSLDA